MKNTTRLTDAYSRVHAQLVYSEKVRNDGVKADGSFQQHGGLLYNGNYGNVLSVVSFPCAEPWMLTAHA